MAKKDQKKAIGKGIRALLNNIDSEPVEKKETVVKTLAQNVAMLSIKSIEVNPDQPRKEFLESALEELSASIKIHGLIQPVTVRRLNSKKYQLISGERRWRASQKAGLKEIPAYIRIANDQEMLEMALVENIQREELNALEIAFNYQRLMEECDLTHETLSERMGKKRSTISNYLRLLKLPPEIQEGLKNKKISMGHARALAGSNDVSVQLTVYKEVVGNELSVRKTEALIGQYSKHSKKSKAAAPTKELPDAYVDVRENLRSYLGTKVGLKRSESGKGQIVINFTSDDDLNRILDLIEE